MGCGDVGGGTQDEINPDFPPARIAAQLTAGNVHTCVLLSDGNVRCWGLGNTGRLGYGTTRSVGHYDTPGSAGDVDVGGAVTQVDAGGDHTCALIEDGSVRCWGSGTHGALGYGSTDNIGDDEAPASAGSVDVGAPVKQISAGTSHTCAVLENGNVRCWGLGASGALGYGNTDNIGDDETPASAGNVDVGAPVKQIAAGAGYTCALLEDDNVRCWGDATYGQLGYGNRNAVGDDETPASVGDIDIGASVSQIAVGSGHTCAVLSTGDVRCWGHSGAGQLGRGNTLLVGDDETPAEASNAEIGTTVTQIGAGSHHACGVSTDGGVHCWGGNFSGQLGYAGTENIGDDEMPAAAGTVDVGAIVKQVTAGGGHTCALLDAGRVRCWGWGGALGYGNTDYIGDDETPASAGNVPYGG